MKIWTVTIINTQAVPDAEPWTSSFSTEEKAEAFKNTIDSLATLYNMSDCIYVSIDSGTMDSLYYLDDFIDGYGPGKEN